MECLKEAGVGSEGPGHCGSRVRLKGQFSEKKKKGGGGIRTRWVSRPSPNRQAERHLKRICLRQIQARVCYAWLCHLFRYFSVEG